MWQRAAWPACTLCGRRGRSVNRPRTPLPGQQPFCKLFWAREVVFLECSLLPHRQYYHPAADAEAGEEACTELVAFHPISGRVLPSQSTHEFPGEAWISAQAPLPGFALLPAVWGSCQLAPAPYTQLCDDPAMATSPTQAPTVVSLRALQCSCCLPAAKHGGEESENHPSCLPRCPGMRSRSLAGLACCQSCILLQQVGPGESVN